MTDYKDLLYRAGGTPPTGYGIGPTYWRANGGAEREQPVYLPDLSDELLAETEFDTSATTGYYLLADLTELWGASTRAFADLLYNA